MSRALTTEKGWCSITSEPQDYNLEIIAEIDTAGSYEFDITLVVRDLEDGKIYWGQDSGCSCPTPFEGVTHTDHLSPLPETMTQLFQAVTQNRDMNLGDGIEFLRKVEDALKVKWTPPRTEACVDFRISVMDSDGKRAYTSDGFATYEEAEAWVTETVVGGLYPGNTFEIRKVWS